MFKYCPLIICYSISFYFNFKTIIIKMIQNTKL